MAASRLNGHLLHPVEPLRPGHVPSSYGARVAHPMLNETAAYEPKQIERLPE
jgi:hypothetical protein